MAPGPSKTVLAQSLGVTLHPQSHLMRVEIFSYLPACLQVNIVSGVLYISLYILTLIFAVSVNMSGAVG